MLPLKHFIQLSETLSSFGLTVLNKSTTLQKAISPHPSLKAYITVLLLAHKDKECVQESISFYLFICCYFKVFLLLVSGRQYLKHWTVFQKGISKSEKVYEALLSLEKSSGEKKKSKSYSDA